VTRVEQSETSARAPGDGGDAGLPVGEDGLALVLDWYQMNVEMRAVPKRNAAR